MARQSPDNTPESPSSGNPSRYFERVAAWLDSNDLNYIDHADQGYVSMGYSGESGDWRVIVDVAERGQGWRLLVYSVYPIRVPEGRRAVVAELIARINYGLPIGNFELCWEDGEVRVRSSMPLEDGDFTEAQLDRLFNSNTALAGHYMAGIFGVAFGTVAPALVLEIARAPAREEMQ